MGAFMVWFGIVAVAAIGATLRLEAAMILDHDSEHQATCFRVVAWSATLTALLVTAESAAAARAGLADGGQAAVVCLAHHRLRHLDHGHHADHAGLRHFAQRLRQGGAPKVIGAASIALFQVGLLLAGSHGRRGAAGRAPGRTGGGTGGSDVAARSAARMAGCCRPTPAMRHYLFRHRAFWRFSLPSNLLNVLVGQLPLFMIGARYRALAAGLFALTQRVLSAPVALLASSVLEVFKRQSVQDFQTHGNCRDAYLYTFKALVVLGIGPSLVLLLFSPQLFAWVFGQTWRPAAEMAQILAPLYFLNFIASPLSYVFFVAKANKRWTWSGKSPCSA
ncbi:oligosaccharide flippase family protein [Massilia sp. B-10]|nr:oligosaccharide flippase family protein [Massilia sp. B-10]